MIDARYKCACMTQEALVLIAERRPNEDISDYMGYVSMALSTDHRRRSPLCLAVTMEYVKLPADNPAGIGYSGGGNA
jgi:hypothetical protein